MGNLVKICNIRKYVMEESYKDILGRPSLITSGLCKCNPSRTSRVQHSKMQRMENIRAKLPMKVRKHNSTTTALKKLCWLPIRARIDHKLLALVYNCLEGNALEYLKELIAEVKPRRDGLWSNSEYKSLHVPMTKRKTLAARSFSVKGPELSNEIPANVRKQKTLDTFKANLKRYLFDTFLNN